MTQTAIYALLTSSLLAAGSLFAERLCAELRWPRRLTWLITILGSTALALLALVTEPQSQHAGIISLPQAFELLPDFSPSAIDVTTSASQPATWLSWPGWELFDTGVAALWIVSTAVFLGILCIAVVRLGRFAHTSETKTIGATKVLISDQTGPAVFGFLHPRIVLPRWLADQEPELCDLVLRHEREHIAAYDHWLYAAMLFAVALMPWNPALWWQLRRLRLAIEMDCDARVLRDDVDARSYARALLSVGQRSSKSPMGSVALTEPASELEQRIKTMLHTTRRLSVAVLTSRLTVVASLSSLALLVNAPGAQTSGGSDSSSTSSAAPFVRSIVYDQLSEAQSCIEDSDFECVHRTLDRVDEMADLSAYEASQLYNFKAFVAFEEDDTEEALGHYEALLGLPRDELPERLIGGVMRNVASLHVQHENWQEGLDTYEDWMNLPFVEPASQDYYIKSTIHYQMQDYEQARAPLLQAIAIADEPMQNQYQMLYILDIAQNNIDSAIGTLEYINSQWPDNDWSISALEQLTTGPAAENDSSEAQ